MDRCPVAISSYCLGLSVLVQPGIIWPAPLGRGRARLGAQLVHLPLSDPGQPASADGGRRWDLLCCTARLLGSSGIGSLGGSSVRGFDGGGDVRIGRGFDATCCQWRQHLLQGGIKALALLRSWVGVVYNGAGRSSSGTPDQHQVGIMVVNKWTGREVTSHLCIGNRFAVDKHVQPQPQQLWLRGGSRRRCSLGRRGCRPADHERCVAVFGCWGSINTVCCCQAGTAAVRPRRRRTQCCNQVCRVAAIPHCAALPLRAMTKRSAAG